MGLADELVLWIVTPDWMFYNYGEKDMKGRGFSRILPNSESHAITVPIVGVQAKRQLIAHHQAAFS